MIVFQVSLNFDPAKEILNAMSDLYFNEKGHYSKENTSGNEDFHSPILQTFQFGPEQCDNENHEKETTAVARRNSSK